MTQRNGKHGGKRPGAGRPKKTRTLPDDFFETAEQYLEAVVQGRTIPDPLRVQAAKAILPFQKRRQRAPLAATRTPREQARADDLSAASGLNQRFRQRVAELKRDSK